MRAVKPSGEMMSQVKRSVENVLDASEAVLKKDESYEVHLGYSDRSSAEALNTSLLKVEFDNNDLRLKGIVASAYYRAWFLERLTPEFQWQEILRLGGSLRFAEEVTEWSPETDSLTEIQVPLEALRNEISEPGEAMRKNGYSLAYEAVGRMLRLKDFDELPNQDLEDVAEAVEALKN